MDKNLMKAIHYIPKNMTGEEKKETMELVKNANMLKSEVKRTKFK